MMEQVSFIVAVDREGEAPAEPRTPVRLSRSTARQEPRPPDCTGQEPAK
jgi:hypothetical protein